MSRANGFSNNEGRATPMPCPPKCSSKDASSRTCSPTLCLSTVLAFPEKLHHCCPAPCILPFSIITQRYPVSPKNYSYSANLIFNQVLIKSNHGCCSSNELFSSGTTCHVLISSLKTVRNNDSAFFLGQCMAIGYLKNTGPYDVSLFKNSKGIRSSSVACSSHVI